MTDAARPFPSWEIEHWIDSSPDCSELPRDIKLDYTGSPDDFDRWICTLSAVTSGGPNDANWTELTWQFYGPTPVAAMVEAALWCRERT